MNLSKLFSPWYWLLLKLVTLGILAFLVYLEVITAMIIFDKPVVSNMNSGSVEYCEGCGLFGPVIYGVEAGVKFIGKVGPVFQWLFTMAFLINSVLLAFWVFIIRAAYKHQKWGAIAIAILSAVSLVFIIPTALEQQYYYAVLPSLLIFGIALKCSLVKPKT